MKNEKLVAKRPLSHPEKILLSPCLLTASRHGREGSTWEEFLSSLCERTSFSGEYINDFVEYLISKEWEQGLHSGSELWECLNLETKLAAHSNFLLDTTDFSLNRINMAYVLWHWSKSGKPIYYLSADIAKALAFTEVPEKTFIWEPEKSLPFRSMYIMLPPIFSFIMKDSGGTEEDGRINGFYLYLHQDQKIAYSPSASLILSTAHKVGVAKTFNFGGYCHPNLQWNDQISSAFSFEKGDSLAKFNQIYYKSGKIMKNEKWPHRIIDRIATNLIWFLHNFPQAISYEQRTFSHADGSNRHHRRKRQNSIRKNKGFLNYSILNLVSKHTKKTDKPASTSKKKATIVAGHLHTYWTGARKENGIEIPREEWEEKRTKIVKWILPYRKGIGEIVDRNIVVKW